MRPARDTKAHEGRTPAEKIRISFPRLNAVMYEGARKPLCQRLIITFFILRYRMRAGGFQWDPS